MAANGIEKFEVANVVGFFVLIVLNDEDSDGCGGSFERDAEPRGRWRAHEFDFVTCSEPIEFGLRNQHAAPGAKDKSGAGATHFLRGGRRVVFICEKWKVKCVGFPVVESDKAIFGV